MSEPDYSQTVSGDYNKIPYKAYPYLPADADGVTTWQVEYKQARGYDWGPRGVFTEKDGIFETKGRDFGAASLALSWHARG